ncbi:hypothetical protein BGX20_003485, partial [Mortierella sp. AD010]
MDSNQTVSTDTASTSQPVNSVTAAFIILGATVGAILLHLSLTVIFKRIVKRTIWQFDDDIVKYCSSSSSNNNDDDGDNDNNLGSPLLTLPSGVYEVVNHVFVIILLFAVSYLVVMVIKCISMAVNRTNSHLKESNPIRAREVETKIIVMTRIIQGVVWVLGLSGIAMTFPSAWQVGVSLLASASVSALLLGFAAKSSIENALASLTIALTQPFLIEDQVVVNNEVGHIEEITSQYVVVRTLDERRLVIPLTWFLANIFQNWSRNSPQQIAECKLYVDYSISVPRIRQAFLRIAREHPKFDGRHTALLVSSCTSTTIELTCQISVANAMDVIQVTSDVREAMVEFIARKGDGVNIYINNPGSGGATPHCSPLPPLTKEDERMGEGSKAYQSCPSPSAVSVSNTLTGSEKPTATTTALKTTPDFVRVDVGEPTPNGTSSNNAHGGGLTRRGVRDTEDGGPTNVDTVVPSLVVSAK